MLSEHRLLKTILLTIQQYKDKTLSLPSTVRKIQGAAAALEGDVPKEVHMALRQAVSELERIYFMVPEEAQRESAFAVLSSVERAISTRDS